MMLPSGETTNALQDRPLCRRSNVINPSDIPKYVEELTKFLGHDALSAAQSELDKDLLHHGRCYRRWAQEMKPWLFAFREYEQTASKCFQNPSAWPDEIRELAGAGHMISALQCGMPDGVKAKYRTDLVSIQHNDFMVEMDAAWHYHLEGYDVKWYPLGQEKCPEFRVRGGGHDFDVECRRFDWDISEYVKTPAIADACDTIYDLIQAQGRWGEVQIRLPKNFRYAPEHKKKWSQRLRAGLTPTQTTIQIDDGIELTLELRPSPSRSYAEQELADLAGDRRRGERVCVRARVDGASFIDPLVMRCCGPRRTPQELRNFVYETLKKKVSRQLSPKRAGVAVVRFNGISDPTVFRESGGIKGIVGKLFAQPHLAAIVLKCDGLAELCGVVLRHSTPAVLFRNPQTKFLPVALAQHLS